MKGGNAGLILRLINRNERQELNETQRIMLENELSYQIINAALKVHTNLGPGLLESAYQECLYFELISRDLIVGRQVPMPLHYKGVKMETGYRIDLFVERKVVIEIKSVENLNDVHVAQLLTYLKLSDSKLGMLINFNVKLLKHGIRRVVNRL